ncbi:zinc finger protein 862-like [Eleginops maclovinus]|uniref:zinc finger protein 862-like n=1 Tax=Eleginops maclovinus TaxID=56733 RepID=UPI00307FF37D
MDLKEVNKAYDATKRKRSVVPAWKAEFPWLIVDESETLFCLPCQTVYGPHAETRQQRDIFRKRSQGSFVKGCQNLKHDTLVCHQRSDGHKEAQEKYEARNKKKGESIAEKTIETLNTKVFQKLKILFINAHALAMHCRPVSDFKWMCEMDEKKGLDLGSTYRNEKSCKEFLVAIAEITRLAIEDKVKSAKFITIMSDGSTDVSATEQEIVYLHFAVDGKTHCNFLGLVQCDKPDANGIYDAIMQAVKLPGIPKEEMMKKIVGFAGDGAAVNTGKKAGVIALMRERISGDILMVQCMAHRVELAFKEAMKQASLFIKVYVLLDALYKLYRIPKQAAGLKAAFSTTNISKIWPVRVGGTRWVSHTHTALQNMLRGYRAIVLHLSQVATTRTASGMQAKAKGLLKTLRSKDAMTFAHFLSDILAVLSKLSKTLQQREVCTYHVHEALKATMTSINKFKDRAGPEQRKLQQGDCNSFEGQTLTGVDHSSGQIEKVVEALVGSLARRFSDMGGEVLKATKIADMQSWPQEHEDDFGDDFIGVIIDHYREHFDNVGVDVSAIEAEWTSLKQALYENQGNKIHSMSWPSVFELYKSTFPNILHVIDLVLSLPAATSEYERGFSQMKITKSQYRNRLKATTMTMLMTIQLHSEPTKDFDPSSAIHQWNQNHNRRPNFMEGRKKGRMAALEGAKQVQEEIDGVDGVDGAQMVAEAAGGAVVEAETKEINSDDSDWFTDMGDNVDSDDGEMEDRGLVGEDEE